MHLQSKIDIRRAVLLIAAGAMLYSGCSREAGHGTYVARVGSAQLTNADVNALRVASGDTLAMPEQYVNDWIIAELLYQEAERRGISDSREIQEELAATKRRLAIAALLTQEVYTSDTSAVNEDAIVTYYHAAGTAFALREDVALVSYVTFADRDAANAFRSRVLRGTPWDDAVAALQADTTGHAPVLQIANRQYFTQSTLFPEELWKLARTLGKEEVSFVVKTPAGFSVLKSHNVRRQGDIADLDYVRNEVRDRIIIEARRLRYEKLIAELRSKHAVEIRMDQADTAVTE